jgi:hypothetical protein
MNQYHLAQLNIAKMKFAIDDPRMIEFVNQLDNINALADAAPGFVWRLETEEGDATAIDFFGSDVLVNMSVWQDAESLHNYVYRSLHNKIMSQRKQWFERMEDAYSILWWVPAGHVPSLEEASERLLYLNKQGPSEKAFTFKQNFSAPVIAD